MNYVNESYIQFNYRLVRYEKKENMKDKRCRWREREREVIFSNYYS